MLRLLWLIALLLVPGLAIGQPATLVADRVFVQADNTLVAEGNVEVFQDNRRLTASRITYDSAGGKLTIEGPLRLEDGTDFYVIAGQAALDQDLKDGILQSARMVLGQRLQVTAAELARIDGRYNQAYKVAATSCQVCAGKTPIWQIRARRIIHDTQEQQIYFDNAVLQILDVPILYLPRVRLPDPNLERSSGFMVPRVRNSSQLKTGIKLPYFIALGDSADLTVTPYFSSETKTVELDYRQAFARGDLTARATLSRDTIAEGETRASFFSTGAFALPRDYVLDFDIETASDRSYLLEYGYSNADRLESRVAARRTTRDENAFAELAHYRTLRGSEQNATQPTVIADARYERRLFPDWLGGELLLYGDAHTHLRTSNSLIDEDGNGLSDGLDLTRLSMGAEWRRDWITVNGLVIGAAAQLNADFYNVEQDPAFAAPILNATPTLALSARLPLIRKGRTPGVTHVLEPQVQIAWSDDTGDATPNDDSTRVEFDEGNLFALSRAPGFDQTERGFRADLGATWTRTDPKGRIIRVTAGRVFRFSGDSVYSISSGLSEDDSDWLVAGQMELPNGIDLLARATFDSRGTVTKNETRLNITRPDWNVATTLVYLPADPAEDRDERLSELTLDAAYSFSPFVTGTLEWRYNLAAGETAQAGAGLRYENECVNVDLSVSRRFTSSATVAPSTEIGLTVGLRGFGTSGGKRPTHSRSCSN